MGEIPDNIIVSEDVMPQEGLHVQSNTEGGQDIDFINEACRSGTISSKYLSIFKDLFSTKTEAVPSEFFRHPIPVATGVLGNTSNIVGPVIQQNAATIQGQPIWANKLSGYAGFRATWCCKFEVAPNPFCSGVFRLVHVPANKGGATGNRALRPYMWDLPGVTLNLSESTSVCLRVPHSTIFPYISTTNTPTSTTTNGQFIIWNVNGVQQGTGSAALTATTWLWLEDVELIVPVDSTVSNVVPQSGNKVVSKQKVVDEEPKGQISKVLDSAAKVSNYMSAVPLLADVTGPAAWTFRVGAKLASAFGYAKPLQTRSKMIKTRAGGYHYNADGEDQSYNLSYMHDSVLAPFSVEGRPLDEMSFSYLTSVPHFITQVNLASQTTGTLLAKGYLSPMSLFTQTTTSVTPEAFASAPFKGFFPSAAMAVASSFVYYRGDFVYKFIIQKTKFHSGRLLFAYNYYQGDAAASTVVNVPAYTSPYMHRTIVDINQTDEFEVKVPFLFPGNMSVVNDYIGTWGLWVLEPVSAPPAAPSTIPIDIIAHMENVTYSSPVTPTIAPTNNYNNIVAQSGNKTVALAAATSGEDLMSTKQLIMKAGDFTTINSSVAYNPWAVVYPTYAPNNVTPTSITYASPVNYSLNLFRTAFAFERGAINIAQTTARSGVTKLWLVPPSQNERYPVLKSGVPVGVDLSTNLPIFKVNRYSNLPAVFTDYLTAFPREAGAYSPTLLWFDVRDSTNVTVAFSQYSVCAADDFSFHSFLGFEPCVFVSTTDMA